MTINSIKSCSENKISNCVNKLYLWQALWWGCEFSIHENEGLRLRTLWPSSSTAQEMPAQHKYQLNLALHWDLLASRKHWILYHERSEMEKCTTTHRLLFWSGPIWQQINKVQCFLFFTGRALHSFLRTIRRTRYSPAQMLKSEPCSSQNPITSIAFLVPFLPQRSMEAGAGEEPPSATEREREETLLPWCATAFS